MSEGPLTIRERYRLDEVLRRAAAVTTYGGTDTETGAPIVVKELRVHDLGEWKEYDLFERQVQTLAAVRHPGVPRLLDHFTVEGPPGARVYLVMERVPGESLERRIERGAPLELGELRRILVGVLEILAHLHDLAPPIVHRDVKPANIVVGDGRVWLVDFGGVRRFLPWAKAGSTVIGTFGYMAPEQLHGESSPATDLYGLGATAAALLAGCDASELPRRGLRIDLDRIPAARPPLREIVARLTEPDPEDRFSCAAEVLVALAAPRGAMPAPVSKHDAAAPGSLATTAASSLPARALPSGYWALRRAIRWGLVGLGGVSLLTGVVFEGLRSLPFLGPLGDAAMVCGQLGIALLIAAFFVRTKPTYRRKLLRLAHRRQGRLHVAEVAHRLRLPPDRAQELLEELVEMGVARRAEAGMYVFGVGA